MNNINSINNFQQGNSGQMSCKDKMKAQWAEVSLFVRFVIITTVTLYTLSWMVSVDKVLSNVPLYTIKSFQIWRLVTSVLMTASILNILFAFMSWVPDAQKLEKTSGTVRYCLNFFVNSFLIQVLYAVSMFLSSFVVGIDALKVDSSGLWPLIMAEITMLCLANPDNQVMMFFIPFAFRAIYYPWALFGFFTLLNFNLQFDILAGICYGYLFFYYLRNYIQFSDTFIMICENNCVFRYFSTLNGFVPLQVSNMNSSFSMVGNNQRAQGNPSNQAAAFRTEPADKTPVTTPFKGRGTKVGNYLYLTLGGISTDNTIKVPGTVENYTAINNNATNVSVERLDASVSDERQGRSKKDNKTGNKYQELPEDV